MELSNISGGPNQSLSLLQHTVENLSYRLLWHSGHVPKVKSRLFQYAKITFEKEMARLDESIRKLLMKISKIEPPTIDDSGLTNLD